MNPSPRLRLLLLAAAVAPVALGAQGSAGKAGSGDANKPPPGMCRIWVDNVPADKQPAPTDCATALKNKPANGRVLFGETQASSRSAPPPMSRPLTIPLGSGFGSRASSASKSRDSTTAKRDSSKTAPKPKRDSVAKKPPPAN